METQTVADSSGTLSSVGHSLAGVGTASKAFILFHPIGMAATGGALLGIGAYYTLGKVFRKKDAAIPAPEATA